MWYDIKQIFLSVNNHHHNINLTFSFIFVDFKAVGCSKPIINKNESYDKISFISVQNIVDNR